MKRDEVEENYGADRTFCTSDDGCAGDLAPVPATMTYPRNRGGGSSSTYWRAAWNDLTSTLASHGEGRREATNGVAERGTTCGKSHDGSVRGSKTYGMAGRTGESFHDRKDPRTTDDLQNKCPDDAEEDSWQRDEGNARGRRHGTAYR